jgi:DnaJ-class molecular chaperone
MVSFQSRAAYLWLLSTLLLSVQAADFYKLLGLSRDATLKEIKKAYRQKSLEFHPDKNKEEGAADKFGEIARAYEVLSDEEKKEVYDQYGEDGLKQHEQGRGGGGGGGFDDVFSQFGFNFGGGGRRQQQERQTPDVEVPLHVTMKQLYLGGTIEVEYVRETLCVNWQDCMKNSQECQGPGVRVKMQQLAPGFVQQVQQRDDRCVAAGKMWRPNCSACPTKTVTEKIDLTIELNPGMRPGELVSFEGVADEKPGYTAGSLHFKVVELPNDTYHRDRDNLYKTVEIPLVDALVRTVFFLFRCLLTLHDTPYCFTRNNSHNFSLPFFFTTVDWFQSRIDTLG